MLCGQEQGGAAPHAGKCVGLEPTTKHPELRRSRFLVSLSLLLSAARRQRWRQMLVLRGVIGIAPSVPTPAASACFFRSSSPFQSPPASLRHHTTIVAASPTPPSSSRQISPAGTALAAPVRARRKKNSAPHPTRAGPGPGTRAWCRCSSLATPAIVVPSFGNRSKEMRPSKRDDAGPSDNRRDSWLGGSRPAGPWNFHSETMFGRFRKGEECEGAKGARGGGRCRWRRGPTYIQSCFLFH